MLKIEQPLPGQGKRPESRNTYIGGYGIKAFGGVGHHARKLCFYGKDGAKTTFKKSRRLISKANELLCYVCLCTCKYDRCSDCIELTQPDSSKIDTPVDIHMHDGVM